MYTGKTLFAQLMDFLPWTTFARIVERYGGDRYVKSLRCTEHFRVMAFAQLTYRESLRDIEACLSAHASKLYHMGFREPIRRSTLSDANEARDWRIYADFAQVLIRRARQLYAVESFGMELTETAYALDSTTIDLCLSAFPWASFRATKAAVKMHTLLDLRGAIPSFIHVSDGKLHDVNVLDLLIPEAGAIYVMDRGYLDFERLHALHQAGAFFVTRAKSNLDARRLYSAPTERTTGINLRPDHRPQRVLQPAALSRSSAPHPFSRHRRRQDVGLFEQPVCLARKHYLRALQGPMAGGAVLQVGQAASAHQAILRHLGERGEVSNLDRRCSLCPCRHPQEAPQSRRLALHIAPDPVSDALRENTALSDSYRKWVQTRWRRPVQPVEFDRILTGQ